MSTSAPALMRVPKTPSMPSRHTKSTREAPFSLRWLMVVGGVGVVVIVLVVGLVVVVVGAVGVDVGITSVPVESRLVLGSAGVGQSEVRVCRKVASSTSVMSTSPY